MSYKNPSNFLKNICNKKKGCKYFNVTHIRILQVYKRKNIRRKTEEKIMENYLFKNLIYGLGDLVALIGEVNCTCFPLRGAFLLSMHPVPHFLSLSPFVVLKILKINSTK
jgi:hypothetical protein